MATVDNPIKDKITTFRQFISEKYLDSLKKSNYCSNELEFLMKSLEALAVSGVGTHLVKFTHSCIKGIPGKALAVYDRRFEGSDEPGQIYTSLIREKDLELDSSALGSAKLFLEMLRTVLNSGVTVQEAVIAKSPELAAELEQLCKDCEIAEEDIPAVKDELLSLLDFRRFCEPVCDEKEKQIFFKTASGYDLLIPLVSSSLVQRIHERRQQCFSEESMAAREAKYNGKYCEEIYEIWPQSVMLNVGGDNPQNVSQLNSKRKKFYLMENGPKIFKERGVDLTKRKFTSLFDLDYLFGCDELIGEYSDFLLKYLDKPSNLRIRGRERNFVWAIAGAVVALREMFKKAPPSWSAGSGKDMETRFFLDSGSEEFTGISHAKAKKFTDRLAVEFSLWLSDRLYKTSNKKLRLTQADQVFLQQQFVQVME